MGQNRNSAIIDNVKLKERINDIVNNSNRINDNDVCLNKKTRAIRVDSIADHLVSKFDAPGSRNFFCKCGWKLSEDEIWSAYERAHYADVKNPLKYFISLCTIKMNR